jgi:hypothetical protein
MEEVVERENLKAALRRVRQNKGSPGIDGMTTAELVPYQRENAARRRSSRGRWGCAVDDGGTTRRTRSTSR